MVKDGRAAGDAEGHEDRDAWSQALGADGGIDSLWSNRNGRLVTQVGIAVWLQSEFAWL